MVEQFSIVRRLFMEFMESATLRLSAPWTDLYVYGLYVLYMQCIWSWSSLSIGHNGIPERKV